MDTVPHFTVSTVSGDRFDYGAIWQHRQLVLVTLPASESPADGDYAAAVRRAFSDGPDDTAVVITREDVPGIPAPGAVVADRWGEIIHSVRASSLADLPPPEDLRDWAEHVRQRCPECEGEWR